MRKGGTEILVFRHPLAGIQLAKGTLKPNEPIDIACARELQEESGLRAAVKFSLGESFNHSNQRMWHYRVMDTEPGMMDKWTHWCSDDGGHEFEFFWVGLHDANGAAMHDIFVEALAYIRKMITSSSALSHF
ncbi:MAG: NUDIX domain-containing protein [Congregibacter sp.]